MSVKIKTFYRHKNVFGSKVTGFLTNPGKMLNTFWWENISTYTTTSLVFIGYTALVLISIEKCFLGKVAVIKLFFKEIHISHDTISKAMYSDNIQTRILTLLMRQTFHKHRDINKTHSDIDNTNDTSYTHIYCTHRNYTHISDSHSVNF